MIIKSLPFKIINKRAMTESISVTPSSIEISSIGGTYKPIVDFFPTNVVDRGLIYTSQNESIATVDADGIITAKKEGTTNIIIKTVDGLKQTILKVTVKIPTASLYLDKTSYTFGNINHSMQFTAIRSSELYGDLVWTTSDSSVATVSSLGLVTSKGVGTCKITATIGTISATATITVQQKVMSLTLSTNKVVLGIGNSTIVKAIVMPENATDKTLIWTSLNENIATVDNNGVIKGVGTGTCRIEVSPVSNPDIKAYISAQIGKPPTGIKVNHSLLTFTHDWEIKQLRATILPDDATDKTVTWTSSNPSVAEVAQDGAITAISSGTCNIIATNSEGHTAFCKVIVDIAVASITVDKNDITLTKEGETSTILATIHPSNANNKTVTWTSTNPEVATVDSNGVVTAKTMGTTTIEAKSNNGKVASTLVYVIIPCESVTLNKTVINTDKIGATFNLVATALPRAITNPTFAFTSTDPSVATVDGRGIVTIQKYGECQIKARYGGKEAICNVIAKPIDVTEVVLKAKSCNFNKVNQTFQIEASVLPNNATFKDLSYNVMTQNAGFSVDKTGLVTCTGILSGTIEVVAHNNVKAVFNVHIDAIDVAVGDYSEKLTNLREAMQSANEKIAQQKMDVAKDNLTTQIANLSSKVNKEIDELDSSLSNIRDNVLAGIEDGVLTDIEKARIQASLDSLKAEKADVDAQYNELYNNTYLVDTTTSYPKTNLANTYKSYNTQYTNLVGEIEEILLLTEINLNHKNRYATKLDNCISAYQLFKKHALIAIDSIAQRKADLLYNDAKTYTDAKIKVESDRITSTVSSVTNLGNQVSSMQSTVTILAGEISSKVDANGISSIIQQNAESVRIAFNGISSGMTVTKFGIELKTNGLVHSVLQNGRLEVMRQNNSSRLGFIGRAMWMGTTTEGCFLNAETGCTVGLSVNNLSALVYSTTRVDTTNVIYEGLNIYAKTYFHNYPLYDVGAIYTSEAIMGSNYFKAPILSATSQVKAQTVHIDNWCQAKKFITYTNTTYKTRSGETKTISVEKSCVDAITPNTEYIGIGAIVKGIATIELPTELYALGASYVIQITPVGDKKVFVAEKNADNFVVKGDDCDFDYIIKVILPKSREVRKVVDLDVEKIDNVSNSTGIDVGKIE